MITAEASQVGALHHGNGRFDLLIRERHEHLLQLHVLDGRGVTGTADESSPRSYFKCIVGLRLCGSHSSLVIS